MKKKLIIVFASLIIVSFVIESILIYHMYMNSMKKKALINTNQLTDQITIGIDNYLKEIDRITLMPFYNDELMSLLNKHKNKNTEPQYVPESENASMNYFLSTLAYDRPEVGSILIFSNDGIVFGNNGNEYLKVIDRDKEWMKYQYNAINGIFIMTPHVDKYINRKVFSIVRPIRSLYENELIGMIKINLDLGVFNKIISSAYISEHSIAIITDDDRNIFFPEETGNQMLISSDYDYIEDYMEMNGQIYFYSKKSSNLTGLLVIGLVPLNDMRDEAMKLVNSVVYMSLLILIVTIIAVYIIAVRIVKPIKHLKNKMELVQKGNLWIEADMISRDEIGELTSGFNKMIVRIRELMNEVGALVKEVYVRKIKERDAQIYALQCLINPHFFYNTLEIINMIAVENDQYDICDITSNFGKLLRYSIDTEQKPVMLNEEINFIKAYYDILRIRFKEKLKIDITIEQGLERCLVPKLILQPLMENSVVHGIKEKGGIISVAAYRDNDELIINLKDNGTGMTIEKINEIERKIYNNEQQRFSEAEESDKFNKPRKGYALYNVHSRIKLLYGDGYGLSIDKSVKVGASFYVKLPMIVNAGKS